MSRRQTLGALSPNQLNSRQSLAPGKAAGGGGKDGGGPPPTAAGRQSLKPPAAAAGRPSVVPRQLQDARASSAGGVDARRSSAFGKGPGSGSAKADPRPLSDKNFFNGCIRTIITYASTHAYPFALSPKILTSPTGKDFTQLAFWLFQRFDPTLKAFGKVGVARYGGAGWCRAACACLCVHVCTAWWLGLGQQQQQGRVATQAWRRQRRRRVCGGSGVGSAGRRLYPT
jgi:kinetochore protein NDC80